MAQPTASRFITGSAPGRARSDGAGLGVGLGAKGGAGAAENFALRGELGVGFKADDDFVALDQFRRHGAVPDYQFVSCLRLLICFKTI